MSKSPILVTGAAGKVDAVGRTIVELLRQRHLPVRALVRQYDERAEALSATGAEIVVGDLTQGADVVRALEGCNRIYFGMSVSPPYTLRHRSSPPQRRASTATWRSSSTSHR